jgi:hypothetical protein
MVWFVRSEIRQAPSGTMNTIDLQAGQKASLNG